MIVLTGADLVLPDRIVRQGTLVLDGGRIIEVRAGTSTGGDRPADAWLHGHFILPGFIDVHVHGIEGVDSLDEDDPLAVMAARLPRYGVTAFCPTSVACAPATLRRMLDKVRRIRREAPPRAARVLPAHLESNFINRDKRGAQPLECLCSPGDALARWAARAIGHGPANIQKADFGTAFDAADLLEAIDRFGKDVGVVTLAPELAGALDLTAWLRARGILVSVGHSAATYEQGLAAIAAGARRATHLFNCMPPLGHRLPGLAGAVLQSDEVAVEVVCDGVHVHPALIRTVFAAKGASRVFAITDGTAASGLPPGGGARLGGHPLTIGEAAFLADGTLAGSVATMDRVFRTLVGPVGLPLTAAAAACSTTPARELGLADCGVLAVGAAADLVVLDSDLSVVQTYVGGERAYARA